MAGALTAPLATAALVLCLAGVAKLRAPDGAATALTALGLPGHPILVRALALCELALGLATIAHPAPVTAAAVAAIYLIFAAVSFALARRRASCGCFGESDVPASVLQSLLSLAFTLLALAAVLAPPHGIGWVLARPVPFVGALTLATAAAASAAVLAYTELPRAWGSWSRA